MCMQYQKHHDAMRSARGRHAWPGGDRELRMEVCCQHALQVQGAQIEQLLAATGYVLLLEATPGAKLHS